MGLSMGELEMKDEAAAGYRIDEFERITEGKVRPRADEERIGCSAGWES